LLGRRAEFGSQTAGLIAKLLPATAVDATALDAVLARLTLTCARHDPALVQRLAGVAPPDWMRSPSPNRNPES
jgi:hypothetical protein